MIKGIAASAGIAIGTAVLVREETIEVVQRTVPDAQREQQRYLDAVEEFVGELAEASALVSKNVGPSEAAILDAQIAIIRDPELTKEVLRIIGEQHTGAEYAFHLICNGYITMFSNLEDEVISARAADFRDIRDRMLRILMGIQKLDLSTVPAGSILIAEDIPPSQASGIDVERIAGIITQRGTKFSHIAIIARALRLPAVVTVHNLFEAIHGGETLILDGRDGRIYISPDKQRMDEYRQLAQAEYQQTLELARYKKLPTQTVDGKIIRLASNLAVDKELPVIVDANADGVGLFRTEFLYMDRRVPPTEEEQYIAYRRVAEALPGKPVVIRTLDIGGDKEIPYLTDYHEQNPFLGHRAVRYCLAHPDLFKTQLAALLRAAVHGDIRIMLPMISCITELRKVKALLGEAKAELAGRGIPFHEDVPLGIMIETPAAVICAEDLAKEASFFSIGTNDLTQYVLAVDRGSGEIASLYNTLHPAVLRMITLAVRAAHSAGIEAGVCGEAAADPLLIPFLVGVGVDELSVSSGALLLVRSLVDGLVFNEWQRRVPAILGLQTAEEVHRFLERLLHPHV